MKPKCRKLLSQLAVPIFLIILFLGVFIASKVMACESYEECMTGRDERIWVECYDKNCYKPGDCPADVGLPGTCLRAKYCNECENVHPIAIDTQKAIAYKLDEISKKLDSQPQKPFNPADTVAKAWAKKESR